MAKTIRIQDTGISVETVLDEGSLVSFDYYPHGDYTKHNQIVHVREGRIKNLEGTSITATYQKVGGLFGNKLVTSKPIVILTRLRGKEDVYKVNDWVRGLDFPEAH